MTPRQQRISDVLVKAMARGGGVFAWFDAIKEIDALIEAEVRSPEPAEVS